MSEDSKPHISPEEMEETLAWAEQTLDHFPNDRLARALKNLEEQLEAKRDQLEAVLGAVQSAQVIASHNAEHHTGFVHIGRILSDIEDVLSRSD